jgi:hemerythrin
MEKPQKKIWTDALSIGNVNIDKDHKKLFDIYNELVDHIEQNKSREEFARILSEMTDYARTHFKKEEGYMRIFSYPGLADHKKSHQEYVYKVAMYNSDLMGPNPPDPFEIITFIRTWWTKHILYSDLEYEIYKSKVHSKAVYQ